MKHTSIEVSMVPAELKALTEGWRWQGFIVLQKVVVGHGGEEAAVKSLLDDIAEEFPNYEPLETAAVCQGIRTFVAAKCKIKEEKK